MSEYYPPKSKSDAFHCPNCQVFAAQNRHNAVIKVYSENEFEGRKIEFANIYIKNEQIIEGVEVAICSHCESGTLWLGEKIIYPPTRSAPPANNDLPDDVKQVYEEAAAIADQSPRAACALLRVAVEMLIRHLGETASINEGIKNLVKKGIDPKVQQSLDIVRIIGNNAVHPGEIDFEDTTDVQALFNLINVIAGVLITQPKQIQALYDGLPESSKKAVEKRDGKTQ